MKRRYAVALTCLLAFFARAQTPTDLPELLESTTKQAPEWLKEQHRVFARNTISADGAMNPGLIPFGVAAEVAFLRFAHLNQQPDNLRQHLRASLGVTGSELEALVRIAAQAPRVAEDARREEGLSLDAICAKVVRAEPWSSIDALQVAHEFRATNNRRAELIENYYRAAFDRLPGAAQVALLRYLDTEVKPRMRWSDLDVVGVATESPDDWLYNQRSSCERRLALPPSDRAWKVAAPEPITAN